MNLVLDKRYAVRHTAPMTTAPRFRRCDVCRRNEHKVAARFTGPGTTPGVHGFCPACWERAAERRPATTTVTVVFDHRHRG